MNSKCWWETNPLNENLAWSFTSEILSSFCLRADWSEWKALVVLALKKSCMSFVLAKKGLTLWSCKETQNHEYISWFFFFSFIARPVRFQLCVQRLEDPWQRKKPETYSSEFFPFTTQTIDIYKAVNNETTCWSPIAKINHTPKNPKIPRWETQKYLIDLFCETSKTKQYKKLIFIKNQ